MGRNVGLHTSLAATLLDAECNVLRSLCVCLCRAAEQLTEGASALLELAKKSNATSPVEAQPQQPQKSVYLVS